MAFTAPVELTMRPNWVAWKLTPRPGEPKPTKVPYDARTGRLASTTDPSTWSSFEEVCAYCTEQGANGPGYVLSADDPYVGIDLDRCRDPETGKVEEWARQVIKRLNSYTEISPSGTGIRMFVKGELPPHGRRKGAIEIYSQARFLTITGHRLAGLPHDIQDRAQELLTWHQEVFGPQPGGRPRETTVSRSPINLSDIDLLNKARNADNGHRFWALWNGDWSAYGSQSEADLALLNHLSFWTGPNEAWLDSLFRSSGLMREKWERRDYRDHTIGKALEGRTEFYSPNGSSPRLEITSSGRIVNPETGEVIDENPWLVYDAADFLAKNIPPVRWTVDQLIREQAIIGNFGPPGGLKTYFATQLALCLATGQPFLGREVVRGKVLIVEEDTLEADFQQAYLAPMVKAMKLTAEELRGWLFVAPPGDMLLDNQERLGLLDSWLSANQPSLVVMDAFYLLHSGEGMTAKDLQPVLMTIKRLRKKHSCAIWLLDHNRKSSGGVASSDENAIDRWYGGRAKSAATDGVVETRPVRGRDGVAEFHVLKLRGARLPPRFVVRLENGLLVPDEAAPEKVSANKMKVFEWLNTQQSGRTKMDIHTATGLSPRTVETAISELAQDGLVRKDGKLRHADLWRPVGENEPDEEKIPWQ